MKETFYLGFGFSKGEEGRQWSFTPGFAVFAQTAV